MKIEPTDILGNIKLYNADCIDVMRCILDNSIDLTVTSPPYDDLRTYNGILWNENIWMKIIEQLYRITKEGGIVVWIVADETKKFCESLTSFKQALYFHKIGFNLLDTMIYYKQNYAPAYPSIMRYANQFEYMFVFSKGKPKTFNPIQIEKREHRNGITSFRKKDGTKTKKYVISNNDKKNASNVWSYPMGNKTIDHPAVFPEKLAEDHIMSWSNENDIVFDPLMGSGTTGVACIKTDRNFIGIELDNDYYEQAKKRLQLHQKQLTINWNEKQI